MGKLASNAGQIVPATPREALTRTITSNWHTIARVMPEGVNEKRMQQFAVSAINKNPKLVECDVATLLQCLMTAASLGLELDDINHLGECYVIPRWNGKTKRMEATYLNGYKGLYKLALNSGEIQSVTVEAVFEGDRFEYRMGDNAEIVHYSDINAEKTYENLVAAYCITRYTNGGVQRLVMSKAEIEKRRNVSSAKERGPWKDWPVEMAKKTVIRAASKTWPLTSEKGRAVREAAAADEQVGGMFAGVFDKPVIEEFEEVPNEPVEPAEEDSAIAPDGAED